MTTTPATVTPDQPEPEGETTMRIVVAGGGIGGLALGAGLRRSGHQVAVHDRDTDIANTGGYHITLDGRALDALEHLVPRHTLRRLLASGSALRLREPDAYRDRRGRLLGRGPDLTGNPSVDVDRVTLRVLLADAVGPDLHLGRHVTGVDHDPDGNPGLLFADGATESADLVVGADGAHSTIARRLAGGPTNHPTGITGFSGRTLRADLTPAGQRRLGPRSEMSIGPRGAALYLGFLDPVGNAALDAPELRAATTTGPTYIWGAMFPDTPATTALRALRGADLRDALLDRYRHHGWAEHTLEVIARADPDSVAAFRFNAAPTRAADLAPWPPGRVTALGDAVHATPPTAGMGAGAAIRDAADLVTHLNRDTPLLEAIAAFEAGMRLRGAEALTAAMRVIRLIQATTTPLGAAATHLATPLLATATRLRR
ncbi:FAD-dependent oxidoreductase [Actinosynnema mirum]|uniref:Monooxygenase FAD-binding n=1 Tax=Actinosynnema mirum (strain ATCC 29888 / DSM 43827 / JCM 3225 / NBRC 14064 / NCIMB 13271 / NRRL B-12336 / IMRU 3971 / 101) TaxID=446462 RepID=C6W9X1_ACTMD|nr:FAD-dependent monooxygenase [Actinosynnema mirum]ACU37338.1 monooxygenase FAD-binding [Actinosynnema mirum DSM 43827]